MSDTPKYGGETMSDTPRCGRTACQSQAHPLLTHSQTGVKYCVGCARKINEANPGLIPWPCRGQLLKLKETQK